MKKSEKEHKYTSTGVKFWRHRKQLESYLTEDGYTVISTHISPEGSCNLQCSYCSVSKRDQHERIELKVIKDYVTKLYTRGLQAVILTGGGEPTLYPHFNELVSWLHNEMRLKVSLITNGTQQLNINVWDKFDWIRVSINNFKDWQDKINIPVEAVKDSCVIGASLIYSGKNTKILRDVSKLANKINAQYVRLLPNCMDNQKELLKWHKKLEKSMKKLNDSRFFHQFKTHGRPVSTICHQAYFRPYLSEVDGGVVFPCDSLVLNDQIQHFANKYAICRAEDILDFMDRKVQMTFDPIVDCEGCVFTENIKLLHKWHACGINKFDKYTERLEHEEFV